MIPTAERGTRAADWLRRNGVRLLLSMALCGALFAYGVAVGVLRIAPYNLLKNLQMAGVEVIENPAHTFRLKPEKFMSRKPPDGDGVALYVPAEASAGATFLVGFFDAVHGMRLIDMNGRVIHDWRVSFNEIWPDADHVERQPHDWDTQVHGSLLFPNGDVVFNFQYQGLVRIDRCGRVKWKLARQTHHSIFEDTDGNLWVPSRKLHEMEAARFPGISAPFQEEFVLKISPDGEVIQEISVLDAIFGSGYEGVLFANGEHRSRVNPPLDSDFTHINDIEVLSPELAGAFPMFAAGDLLVSLRNLNLLVVMSPDTRRIKWAQTGPFLRQHDPDFLPSGQISVFDNRRDDSGGQDFGGSLIREIDPMTRSVVTRYGAKPGEDFYTETMGDHQRLPNGNLFVTESNIGRAFEVNGQGRIVWSYVNRWADGSVGAMSQALRYPLNYMNSELGQENCDG